ncbi:hypothetical protein [Bdellovibrio sp. KM01]|uniref:hypothetical protein n=1 Tax=Bdellovibrio sp. KM01 TaxID=2748865 RepID=UPI0015E92BEF|nr:hypothetical protein [Bdellovibrio sp. KM01]QLY26674.1 hypothetical protein HW988_06590 [Bdellovibrio sp. KM01]
MKFRTFAIPFFLLSVFTAVNARADESWTGVTKTPGDYTSAGVVTITGAVTLNPGTYIFTSLIVNSTLTINGDTTNNSGVIITSPTLTVGASGSINANAKGYAGNAGIGKGSESMGGCHGGFGGWGGTLGEFCTPYAATLTPTTLGSGGGIGGSNTPGAGGGAIKLEVSGTLTVTGSITANGGASSGSSGATKAGGGAGGSIWIVAGTITGAGPIRANGGNGTSGYSGGGGGGAILVSYVTSTYSGTISAVGGTGGGSYNGYSGSALLVDSLNNDLYVNSMAMVANGTYSFHDITIASTGGITAQGLGSKANNGTGKGLCNTTVCAGGSYGGRGGGAGSGLTQINSSAVYGSTIEPTDTGSGAGVSGSYSVGGEGGGAIKLVATGTITINGPIDADGMPGQISAGTADPGGGSGGSVWIVAGNVAGNSTVQAVGGTGEGGAGGGGRIAIHYSGTLSSSLTYDVSVGGGTFTQNSTVGSVAIVDTTNNNLYFPVTSSITSGTYTYNNITIAASVKVSANDGPLTGAGDRPGGSAATTSGGGGGGHGGAGAAGTGGAGGATIGTNLEPITSGSGGGTNTAGRGFGGNGGGVLRLIIANNLTIGTGGNLNADGGPFVVQYGGGGSGGSIWITAKNISSVTTGITAKGGNGDSSVGGGGGGGRIAVYCSGSYSGTLSVAGGTGKNPAGSAGTTYVKCTGSPWFFRGY